VPRHQRLQLLPAAAAADELRQQGRRQLLPSLLELQRAASDVGRDSHVHQRHCTAAVLLVVLVLVLVLVVLVLLHPAGVDRDGGGPSANATAELLLL
jgi:hypothetical protein